jgi:acyl-CoA synthetase (NDP forming)
VLLSDPRTVVAGIIAKGIAFAIVFASGFAEVGDGGEQRQHALAEMFAGTGTRLLGPNANLNAFETFRTDLPGRAIALISQSGHQGRPVFQGQELGIAVSHWAPTGNEADLESADFIRYFAEIPNTGAIAAYIEGFRDGRTFLLAADHAARRSIPLVMVKVGRTDAGRSWAKSHTGHLAGRDDITSAVMRQYGVTRVDGLDELLDTSALFARAKPPVTDGVCVYSISGGTSGHMADLLTAAGISLPELSAHTQEQLREWIPDYLRVTNPVDNGGHPVGDWRGRKILETLLADPAVGVLVVPITGAFPPLSDNLVTDLIDVSATTDKPICVIWGSPTGLEDAYRTLLLGSQLPTFRTFHNCVGALRSYFDYHAFRARFSSPWLDLDLTPSPLAATAGKLLHGSPGLSEVASKELLRAYGINTSRDILCGSAAEAAAAAASLGFPVVMKAASAAIAHKSELGLVRVGVGDERQARDAYAELLAQAEQAAPGRVDGVLVCEQITAGVETVLGVATDELFGPTIMFGVGGISVEVYRDVSFRVPPFPLDEAHRMIREIRGLPLLTGFRGRPAADLGAVADAIMALQRLVLDLGDRIAELDINPLVALPSGVVALDALVVPRA